MINFAVVTDLGCGFYFVVLYFFCGDYSCCDCCLCWCVAVYFCCFSVVIVFAVVVSCFYCGVLLLWFCFFVVVVTFDVSAAVLSLAAVVTFVAVYFCCGFSFSVIYCGDCFCYSDCFCCVLRFSPLL